MSKCRGCRELFRSVQAIKLLKDSVCKKLFNPELFVDSPTHQFEQDGLDSSAAPQPGAGLSQNSTLEHFGFGFGFDDNINDLIFLDPEYFLTALTGRTDTGLTYPTNSESTNLDHQTEPGWFHQTEEPYYDITDGEPSHFTERPSPQRILYGDVPVQLLHEQRAAMYRTDETVSALLPSPQPNYEGLDLPDLCYTSGSPGRMLQSTFDWTDQIPPLQYQHLTSFVCPTIDSGASYERLECEQVAEGDDHFQTLAELQYNSWHTIPQVPSTQARRLGWCAIRNMVRACRIFLSRIRSRMGLKRKCKEEDDYDGLRHKKLRPHKFVNECRLSRFVHGKDAGKVWLGSFSIKEESARAYDVGRMFCSKRAKGFNFPWSQDILSILKDVILNLPLPERKKAIQDVAKEYGNTGHIDGCTRKYCSSQTSNQYQWNSGVGR